MLSLELVPACEGSDPHVSQRRALYIGRELGTAVMPVCLANIP